jgi:hypothetical protein
MIGTRQLHGLRFLDQMPTIGDLYKLIIPHVRAEAAVFDCHPPIASIFEWTEEEFSEYDNHARELDGPGLVYWDSFLIEKYIDQVKKQQMVIALYEEATGAVLVRSQKDKSWMFLYYNYDGILIEVYSPYKTITDTVAEHYKSELVDYPGLLTAPGGAWVSA